jgi:hypothetical protein
VRDATPQEANRHRLEVWNQRREEERAKSNWYRPKVVAQTVDADPTVMLTGLLRCRDAWTQQLVEMRSRLERVKRDPASSWWPSQQPIRVLEHEIEAKEHDLARVLETLRRHGKR